MKSAANAEDIRTKGHKNRRVSRHTGMELRPYVPRVSGSLRRQPLCFFGHADVSPWPAAQRPFVYLMKTYVAYVFRAKRLTQTLHLLFLCPFVLMLSALAANLTEHHNILIPSLSALLNGAITMVLRTSLLTGTSPLPAWSHRFISSVRSSIL